MISRIVPADAASPFSVLGATVLPIASADDTASAFEVFVLDLAPGARSPLHALSTDKVFHVLTGSVALTVDADVVDAGPGTTAHIAAGTAHCYENRSGAPAQLLAVVGGGSQLAFLRGMGELAAAGRPDPAALAGHTARHGVRLVATAER